MKNLFFIFILAPLVSFAQPLRLTSPKESTLQDPVDVNFVLEEDQLTVVFNVKTKVINAKPKLGPKEYPYQRDVVEIFISASGSNDLMPYYEFELSPLGQTFEVRVDDLHKTFVTNLKMGVEYRVQRSSEGWTGEMKIPLKNLNWNGDPSSLRGNAFAVLGKAPNRSYWSLFLPPQVKPNFHRPEYFRELLN